MRPTPKTSTSIQDAKAKVEQHDQLQQRQAQEKSAEVVRENPFTDDQLSEAWELFKKEEAPALGPVMATVMNACSYRREGNDITVFLANSIQETQFPLKLQPNLLRFLRNRMQNDMIDIKAEVKQDEGGGPRKIYTDEDKLKALEDEYPSLRLLREKLGLVLG